MAYIQNNQYNKNKLYKKHTRQYSTPLPKLKSKKTKKRDGYSRFPNNNNKKHQNQLLTQSECAYNYNDNITYPQQLYQQFISQHKRKPSCIEQQAWFYKKSRHIKVWRHRWTMIKYHETTKQYMLCTYKTKEKLANPTESIIIDDQTQIKYSKSTENNNYIIKIMNIEFKTADCKLSLNWIKAINLIIHLCEMRELNVTQIPNYICNNELYFIIYGYLHRITKLNYIQLQVINTIFYFSKYSDKSQSTISPKYCLMHRIIVNQQENYKDKQHIDLIELLSGNTMNLNVSFNAIRDNCAYYYIKNKPLPPYALMAEKVRTKNDRFYNLIFRIGGNDISHNSCTTNECEMIAFKPSFNDSQSKYYHLPAIGAINGITSTSVIFNESNNLLFVIGGIIGKTYNQRRISNKIYGLDLYNEYNHGLHWRDISMNLPLTMEKYAASCIFLTENKLLIMCGLSTLLNNQSHLLKNNTVELYAIDGLTSNKKKSLLLSSTQTNHLYGGCCKGVGYDNSKICIGSNIFVEMYDSNKDNWQFIGKQTHFNHIYAQLWCHEKNKNVLFIASPNNNAIEWCDVRQNKWNVCDNRNILKTTRNLCRNNVLFV